MFAQQQPQADWLGSVAWRCSSHGKRAHRTDVPAGLSGGCRCAFRQLAGIRRHAEKWASYCGMLTVAPGVLAASTFALLATQFIA